MERIHNILYILTVLLMYLHFVFVLWVPTFIQCLYLASIFAAPVRTRSIQVNLPVSSTVTLSHQTSRVEAMLLLKLWTEQKWTGALPSCRIPRLVWATVEFNATFWGMWRQRAARAQSDKSANWFSHRASLNQLLLRTLPLNLTAMHQLAAGLLTASLLHNAATVGTVVHCTHTTTCTHCSMKDSTGQFLCAGYWHCISTYCLVWHLPVKGPQTSDKSCCQVFIAVENFPLFAVDSFLIKK